MSSTPMYAQIAEQLANDIARKRYKLGEILPPEPDLALKLGVSRSTVRAALARLEQRGLVSRRKNVGTRVEALHPVAGYSAQLNSVTDLLQWAQACARQVQSAEKIVADARLKALAGIETGTSWLRIRSLRFDANSGHLPVALTDAYLPHAYAEALPVIRKHPDQLMSGILEKSFGLTLTTVMQKVEATQLDRNQAGMLSAHAGEAALRVVRQYLTADKALALLTVSIHPSSRFAITTVLTRN